MVQRLSTAQTATFSQSLIMPIAYLMHESDEQAKQVMDLLESIRSRRCHSFLAAKVVTASRCYARSGSTMSRPSKDSGHSASVRLLGKGARQQTPIPEHHHVRGDILPDNSGIIRTRSRAKTMPHQYTSVPMFAKIIKVLLKEWSSASHAGGGGAGGRGDGARTPETDDEDGEWDDEYEPRGQGNDDFAFLSDMLGPGGLDALQNDDDLALEDDEDLKSDPVYSMDLKSWLSQYLQHLAQTAGRSSFESHCRRISTQKKPRCSTRSCHDCAN